MAKLDEIVGYWRGVSFVCEMAGFEDVREEAERNLALAKLLRDEYRAEKSRLNSERCEKKAEIEQRAENFLSGRSFGKGGV